MKFDSVLNYLSAIQISKNKQQQQQQQQYPVYR